MRRTPARPLLVAAALGLGLALLTSAGAADPATDAEFKALVEQDAKVIQRAADAVEKTADPDEKKRQARNASNGIKSAALLMATYANDRIGGADPAADGQAAAVRDQAVKIYKAGEGKKFAEAAELARGLAAAKPTGSAQKIDVLKELGEVTTKETMHNFTKTAQFGTNVEADIIAAATKKGMPKGADAALIARRVLALAEVSKAVKKGENAADKKTWDDYNAQMMKAAEELLAVSKKKATPADLTKAFGAVNARCNACHEDDKVGKNS